MKAPRNPIVEAINYARGEMGLPPGPPSGVLLPTRAVTMGGTPIPDSQPYIDGSGLAVTQPGVSDPSMFEPQVSEEWNRIEQHPEIPQEVMQGPSPGTLRQPTQEQIPSEIILPEQAQAFWNGLSLLLTADEVMDIRDVCRRAALRMLQAERERLEDAMSPTKRTRRKMQKKSPAKRKNVRRVRRKKTTTANEG